MEAMGIPSAMSAHITLAGESHLHIFLVLSLGARQFPFQL